MLSRMVLGEISLRKRYVSKDLKEAREWELQESWGEECSSGGGMFHRRRRASAKALRQEFELLKEQGMTGTM